MKSCILILLTSSFLLSGTYLNMFNGTDLSGWHVVGGGEWKVENGEIAGLHPAADAPSGALATDSSFTDFLFRFKMKWVSGNSGIYFRAREGGWLGMIGINVEWMPGGSENDVGGLGYAGESGFERIILEHKAMEQGIFIEDDWNEMTIEAQDRHVITTLNGEEIVNMEVPENLIDPEGQIGFQVHNNFINEMYIKDIELFIPTIIPGCLDSAYEEYDREANLHFADSCRTAGIGSLPGNVSDLIMRSHRNGIYMDILYSGTYRIAVYDVTGNMLVRESFMGPGLYSLDFQSKPGIHFIRIERSESPGFLRPVTFIHQP